MAGGLTLRVRVSGAVEQMRACSALERSAERRLRDEARDAADDLAVRVQAAGRASDRQSARAAGTVRVAPAGWPQIVAGPHPLLFGSEFGATAKFGWYRRGRYWDSPERQFRPHLGSGSYWFFRAQEENEPWIDDHWGDVLDEVVGDWPR